jgi:hypothetical protein
VCVLFERGEVGDDDGFMSNVMDACGCAMGAI